MLELMKMDGRIAVVTGAGQGMGKEIAKALASLGATVVVAELSPKTGEATAREIISAGGKAEFRQMDVRDTKSVIAAADYIKARFGRLDIAVNNAGIVKNAATLETSDADWLEVIEVNLNGVFRCCREFGRLMVAPDLTGRGLGRWLLEQAEAMAPGPAKRFELNTGVLSAANIRRYRRAGYRPADDGVEVLPGTIRLLKDR